MAIEIKNLLDAMLLTDGGNPPTIVKGYGASGVTRSGAGVWVVTFDFDLSLDVLSPATLTHQIILECQGGVQAEAVVTGAPASNQLEITTYEAGVPADLSLQLWLTRYPAN